MIILALDTTLSACSAALWDASTQAFLAKQFKILGKGHGEAIGPMVQNILAEAGVAPAQISRIAVTTGPGTFTGLRIGLSFALGMAAGLQCDVVGINTLAATAAPLINHPTALAVMHEAGATGKFYAARFEPKQDLQHSDSQVVFATLSECLELCSGATIIGSGADVVMAAGPVNATRLSGFDLPDAALFAPIAANFVISKTPLHPLYLREPDAKPAASQPPMTTRLATANDLDRLAVLHAMSFSPGWSSESFASALSLPGAAAMVLELAGEIRGFVQFQTVAGETEINTICVEPRWRKRGLAKRLLSDLLPHIKKQGAEKLHLDVAEDNAAAMTLYRNIGFTEVGRRKGYYARNSTEAVAAILMSRSL